MQNLQGCATQPSRWLLGGFARSEDQRGSVLILECYAEDLSVEQLASETY